MRRAAQTLALLASVVASSLIGTQSIDFAAVQNAPTPTQLGPPTTGATLSQIPTYAPSEAAASASAAVATNPVATSNDKKRFVRIKRDAAADASSLSARNACDAQPRGAGPATSPDTAEAFLANGQYADIQNNAPVPQGYSLVFQNLQGATQQNGYLGYYTLSKYDTVKCQQYCDATSTCTAFNVYMERDPSVEPGAGCTNPPSTVNFKCSLYGLPVSNTTATNTGQWRDDFHVVITASNGYVKLPAPASQDGFKGPASLGGAIQAPNTQCGSTYIGMRFFAGPYDPGQCAAVCNATTQFDADHLVNSVDAYDPCNFFVSYVLSKNNAPQGTYCAMYTRYWSSKYATNTGQYDGDGHYYSVSQAYSWTLSSQDPGVKQNP